MCMIPLWKAALLNFHVMYPEHALFHVTRSYSPLKSRHMYISGVFLTDTFFFKRRFRPLFAACRLYTIK